MTKGRRSATARSVPAQTPEQLLELTQEHIRPLIAMIDRLNEAGAEHDDSSEPLIKLRKQSCAISSAI